MKKAKAIVCVILAVLMLGVFAGCNAQVTASEPSATASTQDVTTEESQTPEPVAATEEPQKEIVIGFNNLSTEYEFFKMVEDGINAAAAKNNVKVLVAQSNREAQKVKANIDSLVIQGAQLIVDFNVLPEICDDISTDLKAKGIPMISIDCVYKDAYFFGANNMGVGILAGKTLGEMALEKWGQAPDFLFNIGAEKSGEDLANRNRGATEGIRQVFADFPDEKIVWLDASNSDFIVAKTGTMDFLTAHPDSHIVMLAYNDPAAVSVLAAIETAGRTDDVILMSQGCEPAYLDNLKQPQNSWVASTAFFPEKYGEYVVNLALDILNGKDMPKMNYVEHVAITRNNVEQYYPGTLVN